MLEIAGRSKVEVAIKAAQAQAQAEQAQEEALEAQQAPEEEEEVMEVLEDEEEEQAQAQAHQQGLGEAAKRACQQQEPQAQQAQQQAEQVQQAQQAQQQAEQAEQAQQAPVGAQAEQAEQGERSDWVRSSGAAGAQAEQGERSDWVRSSGAAGAQAEQERRRFLRDEERRQLAEAFPQHAAAQPNEAREEGIETAFAQHTASRQFRRGTIGPNEVDYATRVYGGATGAADVLPAGTSLPNSVRTSIWRCAHDDCHGSPKEYPSRDSVRNHCKRHHRAWYDEVTEKSAPTYSRPAATEEEAARRAK